MNNPLKDTTKRNANDVAREQALSSFQKLDCAIQLIEEALAEQPSLKTLQLEPMLRSLSLGLRILSAKDFELDLKGLTMKHGWRVGQHFYVRCSVQTTLPVTFRVLPGEDLPEGILIPASRRTLTLSAGERVGLKLELRRRHRQIAWHIRAIDHDRL